jgi:hypothetical protein
MVYPPSATPRSAGRVFGTDWSIVNVATLLRSNAGRGVWRPSVTPGGYTPKINQHYIQTVSAQHLPTGVNVIFMQLDDCWRASICFCADGELAPWNDGVAELWLRSLFGQDRPNARAADDGDPAANASVRNFILPRA